jgi:hypothetical protein
VVASSRSKGAKLLAALVVAGLVLPPAFAAGANDSKRKPPAVALSLDTISTFTPANADPRLAAALAGRPPSAADFKFTPAASKSRPSQLRVAIRARTTASGRPADIAGATSAGPIGALTSASYNLGVAVGWRRFAVTGDIAKVNPSVSELGGREGAVVGVNYSLKRFTGRVAVAADRTEGRQAAVLPDTRNYSLDVGGAYSITGNLAVTGGVRYKVERDRLAATADQRRDSQAVYVGTAFKF